MLGVGVGERVLIPLSYLHLLWGRIALPENGLGVYDYFECVAGVPFQGNTTAPFQGNTTADEPA